MKAGHRIHRGNSRHLRPAQSSRVGETPGLTNGAPIAQSAEAADLKSVQSGFESQWGHSDSQVKDVYGRSNTVTKTQNCHGLSQLA